MMPLGLVLLAAVGILLLFGVLHRVMDRMRLNDKAAFFVVLAMFVGSLIPNIPLGPRLSVNIGGAIIPLIVCIRLLFKAGTTWEWVRALIASVVSAGLLLLIDRYFPSYEGAMPFDAHYLFGIVAGLVAYLLGRSRRSALIAGVLGVLLGDVASTMIAWRQGYGTVLQLGGAGALDAMVISMITAVVFCELLGESFEKLRGGTSKKNMRVEDGEFVHVAHTGRHER